MQRVQAVAGKYLNIVGFYAAIELTKSVEEAVSFYVDEVGGSEEEFYRILREAEARGELCELWGRYRATLSAVYKLSKILKEVEQVDYSIRRRPRVDRLVKTKGFKEIVYQMKRDGVDVSGIGFRVLREPLVTLSNTYEFPSGDFLAFRCYCSGLHDYGYFFGLAYYVLKNVYCSNVFWFLGQPWAMGSFDYGEVVYGYTLSSFIDAYLNLRKLFAEVIKNVSHIEFRLSVSTGFELYTLEGTIDVSGGSRLRVLSIAMYLPGIPLEPLEFLKYAKCKAKYARLPEENFYVYGVPFKAKSFENKEYLLTKDGAIRGVYDEDFRGFPVVFSTKIYPTDLKNYRYCARRVIVDSFQGILAVIGRWWTEKPKTSIWNQIRLLFTG